MSCLFALLEEMTALRKTDGLCLPSMSEMFELSDDAVTYQWVCSAMIKCVVGNTMWNRRYYKEALSDIATCSDEAFLLLTLENNYGRWLDEWKWLKANRDVEKEDRAPKNFRVAMYTNSGHSKKNGRSKRFSGWSREGYLRFNAIYALVAADRQGRANFEADLKATFVVAHATDECTPTIAEDDEEIFPAHDMLGVAGSQLAPIVTPRAPSRHPAAAAKRSGTSSDDENSSQNSICDNDDDSE
jgi:hypothetical protein